MQTPPPHYSNSTPSGEETTNLPSSTEVTVVDNDIKSKTTKTKTATTTSTTTNSAVHVDADDDIEEQHPQNKEKVVTFQGDKNNYPDSNVDDDRSCLTAAATIKASNVQSNTTTNNTKQLSSPPSSLFVHFQNDVGETRKTASKREAEDRKGRTSDVERNSPKMNVDDATTRRLYWYTNQGVFRRSLNTGPDEQFTVCYRVIQPFNFLVMNATDASLTTFLNDLDRVQLAAEKTAFSNRVEGLLIRNENAPALDPVPKSLYNKSYKSSKEATGLRQLQSRYSNRREHKKIESFSDAQKFEYVRRTLKERIDDCTYIRIETVKVMLSVHLGLWRGPGPTLAGFRMGAGQQGDSQFLINAPAGSSVGDNQVFERTVLPVLAAFLPDDINNVEVRSVFLDAIEASRGAIRSPNEIPPVQVRSRSDISTNTSSIGSESAGPNNNNNGGNGGGGTGGTGRVHNNNSNDNNGGNGGGGTGGGGTGNGGANGDGGTRNSNNNNATGGSGGQSAMPAITES